MRLPRITAVLASIAIAAGGLLIAAPPASAAITQCAVTQVGDAYYKPNSNSPTASFTVTVTVDSLSMVAVQGWKTVGASNAGFSEPPGMRFGPGTQTSAQFEGILPIDKNAFQCFDFLSGASSSATSFVGGDLPAPSAPDATVTCTATPANPFIGDTVTVTSTVTNASAYDSTTATVAQGSGTPSPSPVTFTADATGATFTCAGSGTKSGVTKTASATATVPAGQSLPDPSNFMNGSSAWGDLTTAASGNPTRTLTLSLTPPAGWRTEWSPAMPAVQACGATVDYTPSLVRDGVTNSNSPITLTVWTMTTPSCDLPAPVLKSANFATNGDINVNYTPPTGLPGLQLFANWNAPASGQSGKDVSLGAPTGTSTIPAGVRMPSNAKVTLYLKAGSTLTSASSNEVTVTSLPPTILYPALSGVEGSPIKSVSPNVSSDMAQRMRNAGYEYTWFGPVPKGLSIDRQTGEISGTPTIGVGHTYLVKISSAGYPEARSSVVVDIKDLPPVAGGLVYQQQITDVGAPISVKPKVNANGKTPAGFYAPDLCSRFPGLTINVQTGEITGTPLLPARGTVKVVAVAARGLGDVDGCRTPPTNKTLADGTASFTINASALAFSYPQTTGVAGSPLTITPTTSPAADPSITYTVNPALPAGLNLDPATGVVSGTPTAAVYGNHHTVTVTKAQTGFPTQTSTADLILNISPIPAAAGALPAYPTKTSTVSTPAQVAPSVPVGFTGTYVLDPASATAGMTIDPATGVISWTPATVGASTVTVTVVTPGAGAPQALPPFTWTVTSASTAGKSAPPPTAGGQQAAGQTGGKGGSNPDYRATCTPEPGTIFPAEMYGSVGSTFTMPANVKELAPGSVATVIAGALPAGLRMYATDGVIAGTPEKANNGHGPVTIAVTAPDGTRRVAEVNFAIDDPHHGVNYPDDVVASVGQPITVTPFTANEHGATTYKITCGSLPDGLSLNTRTGEISGVPTTENQYPDPVHVSVTDDYGTTTSSFLVPVSATVAPWIRYPEFSQIGIGDKATITPTTSGLPSGGTFTINGDLPAGMTFNPSTGVISGKPKFGDDQRVYEPTITYRTADGAGLAETWASMNVTKHAVPMAAVSKKATAKLKAGKQVVLISKVKHPKWVSISEAVKCTGGCTWKLNKKTGKLVVTPSTKAKRVSVSIIGDPVGKPYTEQYADHAWSRSWKVTR